MMIAHLLHAVDSVINDVYKGCTGKLISGKVLLLK